MLETLLRAPALKCGINFSCWFSLASTPGLVLWLLLLLWRGVTVAQASCKAQGVTPAAVMPYRVDPRRSCSGAHPWTAKVPDLWAVRSWAEPLFAWAPWKVQMGSTGSPCAVLGAQGCAWGQPRQRWDADWAFSRRRLHPRRFSERILEPVPLSRVAPRPCVRFSPGVSRAPSRLGVCLLPPRRWCLLCSHSSSRDTATPLFLGESKKVPKRRHSRRQKILAHISMKETCKLLSVKTSALRANFFPPFCCFCSIFESFY